MVARGVIFNVLLPIHYIYQVSKLLDLKKKFYSLSIPHIVLQLYLYTNLYPLFAFLWTSF